MRREGGGGKRAAADAMAEPRKDRHMIPVWFFVGIQLLIFGVLIVISGVAEFSHPPGTVLANLHAPIWWGAVLIAIGGTYVWKFYPRKP
jgi:FtsH-binding integral membrane protein